MSGQSRVITETPYTPAEMMAAVAARELKDGEVVFVEIAIHARRTLVVARLDRRAFPETVDFITSPGHCMKGRRRRELGMPGAGPTRVVTDKAILEAEAETGELVLAALYPGVEVQDV